VVVGGTGRGTGAAVVVVDLGVVVGGTVVVVGGTVVVVGGTVVVVGAVATGLAGAVTEVRVATGRLAEHPAATTAQVITSTGTRDRDRDRHRGDLTLAVPFDRPVLASPGVRVPPAPVRFLGVLGLCSCVLLTSCGRSVASSEATAPPRSSVPAPPSTVVATTTVTTAVTTTTASPPAFVGTVATVTAADLPSTYRPGCPVGPPDLRKLTMGYWGFDGLPHVGTMVVNVSVVPAVLAVFGRLYGERFPIRGMVPEDAYGGSDPASMAADNTSGFNCRYAVAPGPPQWSVHAYGEAIDVDPVENPYLEGGQWLPAAGAAFADRTDVRPGMAVPGGALTAAFAAVGWYWGGRWTSSPDYQHFSSTGG